MRVGLTALADFYEENGVRIAKIANGLDGVSRSNAETAAHCFTIAVGLRAASAMSAGTAETQSGSGLQPASAVPKADAQ